MHNVIQDLRFAARSFRRSPRFAVPAILALALGIGATSAIFSVVRGVMLRPLPYSDPERIVVVWESSARRNRNVIADANFVEWRERNRSFTHLAMAGPTRISVMLGGQPEEVDWESRLRGSLPRPWRSASARPRLPPLRRRRGPRRRHHRQR